jgi:hypothetical protein
MRLHSKATPAVQALDRKTTTAIMALAFVAGATLAFSAQPAKAATLRSDCDGATCVRTYCDDDGYCTQRSYDRSAYENTSRFHKERYACDSDGDNCHWTRSYYLDEDGNAIYDPGMNQYP